MAKVNRIMSAMLFATVLSSTAQCWAVDKFGPFVCDPLHSGLMTAGYVNNVIPHHAVIAVTVPQEDVDDFNCNNAGGLIRFATPINFNSMSVILRLDGDIDPCNDINLVVRTNDDAIHAICLPLCTRGRDYRYGFTKWTVTSDNPDLEAFTGLPVIAAGIEFSRHPARPNIGTKPGKAYIQSFLINGVEQRQFRQTEETCPFVFSSCD